MSHALARSGGWALVLAVVGACGHAHGAPSPAVRAATADSLFARGHFGEARQAFSALVSHGVRDYLTEVRLGTIALLANEPSAAVAHLSHARALRASEVEPQSRLIEAYYRLNQMALASDLARALGRRASADKLEWLASTGHPYELTWSAPRVRVRFTRTDPLPVVQVKVNGSAPAYFIIDTGAGETILDPSFAAVVRARTFGADSSAFAGGKIGVFQHGAIDSLELGELTVRNLPVHVQSTRNFSAAGGGLRIDGIIGTGLFMRLMATLDYPAGELRLQPKGSVADSAAQSSSLPMWVASDHLMLIWGRANQADSVLMLLDTGLVGAAFIAPDTVFRAAGLNLEAAPSVQGIGGGGAVTARPIRIARLQFGPLVREDVSALAGVFPPTLEHQFGFPIEGLISHDLLRAYALSFDFARMRVYLRGPRADVSRGGGGRITRHR